MLESNGYKMFYGEATVTPPNPKFPAAAIVGTWLYRPDTKCWHINGAKFRERHVSDFHEFNPGVSEETKDSFDRMFHSSMKALNELCEIAEAWREPAQNG